MSEGQGNKARNMHQDSTQSRGTVFLGLRAISSVPGVHQMARSTVFYPVRLRRATYVALGGGIKKEVLSRAIPVVTVPEVQRSHWRVTPSPDSGPRWLCSTPSSRQDLAAARVIEPTRGHSC